MSNIFNNKNQKKRPLGTTKGPFRSLSQAATVITSLTTQRYRQSC